MAMPAEEFDGDNPSYRAAMKGDERSEWKKACIAEIENLEVHDAFAEVLEDTLDSWCEKAGRASDVCECLWVLRRKRGANNEVLKYKGRCVYDGRGQKRMAKLNGRELNSYAPCARGSTVKCQLACAWCLFL